MSKSILLVDDHAMIRDAVKQYLKGNKDFKIEAEAENGKQAFDLLMSRKFDLVITDINMPVSNGLELIENIRLNFKGQLVLALTMDISPSNIRKLNALDIQGYVLKNVSPKEFVSAISQIFHHKKYFSNEVAKELNNLQRRESLKLAARQDRKMSEIERKVLEQLMVHKGHREISDSLGLSNSVLDRLIKNLYQKANCKSLPGLIVYGFENGLS